MDDLFYPGAFEFHMGLDRDEALLAKRQQFLAEHPEHHDVLLPEGEPLLCEFARLLAGWGVVAKPPTETGGILFGIRLEVVPLAKLRENRTAHDGLLEALKTMPNKIADYKNLARARERLIELLD